MIPFHDCHINHFNIFVNVANIIFVLITFGVVVRALIDVVTDLLICVFTKLPVFVINSSFGVVVGL